MSRWRIAVVTILLGLPILVLVGIGTYDLWAEGLGFWVWWPLTTCMGFGYYLMWYWMHKHQLIQPAEETPPVHWTERDREAWKLVEARAKVVAQLEVMEFNEFKFYADLAQDMALELAKFYHPEAADPLSSLTVPEILAVVELASHDLADLVDKNVPGGHVMTIKDWRWAKKAADQATKWYRRFSNVYWLGAAFLSPVDTAIRYTASQLGLSKPFQMFQQDLVAWFHTAFVHRLGTYLIDLNSGRLRVGASRYRALTTESQADGTASPPPGEAPVEHVGQVALTIMGQVKMGKSSFCNALLGEQRARTDVLPATSEITRYELQLPDIPTRLVLLDTVGYSHQGPKQDQLRATQEAAQQSDLLILVLHARSPARQADLEMLQELGKWFASKPDLKMPPVLAVITHIDLLTPAMEWAPPYNWEDPKRPKERSIQEALTAVRDQLGEHLVGAVPVVAAEGKVYGIEEFFLPTLVELLGEARAVGLLRCLRAEVDTGKVRKVFRQFATAGEHILGVWWRSLTRQP
jgi:predicted GTPase